MNRAVSLALVCTLLLSCKEKTRVDLAKMTFTENAASFINYEDKYAGGVNTIDSRFSFALEAHKSSSFSFNGFPIDSATIIFQLRSDKIRKDTTLYQGGGTADQERIKNPVELRSVLNKFQADSVIYGYHLAIKTKELQSAILKELIKLYGPRTKNPNTDRGLYWNLKSLHRFIFYDPDYRVLIVTDNTHLSKNCFSDFSTGTVDLGGCDIAQYNSELFK